MISHVDDDVVNLVSTPKIFVAERIAEKDELDKSKNPLAPQPGLHEAASEIVRCNLISSSVTF